ncbi:MAG: RND family transporter [Rhodospirillaceae bacterium]|nr:RND family transporter [Rhodospirillaceae bacterium]
MNRFVERLADAIFGNRGLVMALFAALTIFLGWQASLLKVDAGFEKQLPLKHPYIKTFLQYQDQFGGANRLLIAVKVDKGDIFTPEFFTTMKQVTDAVFFLPGVDRSTVTSIYTPNVRFIEIVEGGFAGGNVIPADFQPTPEMLSTVRENILKSGQVGRLVANDFTAALVSAQLVERDPQTGQKLDYFKVADLLESDIRAKFEKDGISIHIVGFAKVIGDVADGALGVVGFFVIAFFISAALVYFFTHSIRMMLMPLICSLVAVVWNMGLLTVFNFGLDPMSILVPFLTFAIGVSHGVQKINVIGEGILQGMSGFDAAKTAFKKLVLTGAVAALADVFGFLTILLIDIRIIQEVAITASIGVFCVILTNLFLIPLLASFLELGPKYRERLAKATAAREPFWQMLASFTEKKNATIAIGISIVLFGISAVMSRDVRIGDVLSGVPELRPESRYNQDDRVITKSFSIGTDVIQVIVETVPNGCIQHDVMAKIDDFAWEISNITGVQSTISMPQAAKLVNAGWNEGNLKWRVLPRNEQLLVQSTQSIDTSTGLLNRDCSVMPVVIFTKDHKAETIEHIVKAVKDYAKANDSERHKFRLATGNVGVMAATNEVVAANEFPILLWVYAAIGVLCLALFRSWRPTICILLPLVLVSFMCYWVMVLLDIGLKVSTLPVAALGVGIGVDYGIYIFARLKGMLDRGTPLREAFFRTLQISGNAVVMTGLTLTIGVGTWIFSALQFQADMGLLLSFMFVANMLGAIILLPALARIFMNAK